MCLTPLHLNKIKPLASRHTTHHLQDGEVFGYETVCNLNSSAEQCEIPQEPIYCQDRNGNVMLVDQQQCNWDKSGGYRRSSYQQPQQPGYSPRKIWNAPQNLQQGQNASQPPAQASQGQQIRIMSGSQSPQFVQSPQQSTQKGQTTRAPNLSLCYRCKTLGHFARDCPHPSKTMLLF